jgi:predicted metal-dependent hydrolase
VADTSALSRTIPTSWLHPGGEIALRLRASRRAQRLALRIDAQADAIDLVLPPRTSLTNALRFLEANRQWLDDRLALLPPRIRFAEGEEIPIMGVPHRIRHMGRLRGRGAAWIEAQEIRVSGDPEFLARRVRDFLRDLARSELSLRAKTMAALIERKVRRVSVRDTSTRWGSCSQDGNLAFSWRLILAPESVLDYVVAHEVAHLIEMNHGIRFWRLVERLAPDAKRERHWLNRNRAQLLRVG